MTRKRASFGLEDFSDLKPSIPKKDLQKEIAEDVARESGFTSRHSNLKPKIDGRKLRATNRTSQLNMSVKPETRDEFWLLASENGFNAGEDFLKELMETFKAQNNAINT